MNPVTIFAAEEAEDVADWDLICCPDRKLSVKVHMDKNRRYDSHWTHPSALPQRLYTRATRLAPNGPLIP